MPRRAHSSRSAGSRVPGRQQAELDRRAEPVDGLLERGLRADGREQRLGRCERPERPQRSAAPAMVPAALGFTAARTRGSAPSR